MLIFPSVWFMHGNINQKLIEHKSWVLSTNRYQVQYSEFTSVVYTNKHWFKYRDWRRNGRGGSGNINK